MAQTPLSVVILTFNEESNLAAALDSVKGWAAEVFVVDSFSTDRTVDIALERSADGVSVVQHAFENYSAQWNWALQHLPITQPWVLKLDADERATEPFRRDVSQTLAAASPADMAFIVHWRLIFMGKPLRWGGLYPNGNTRIWRHGHARFGHREVNEHLVVEGNVGNIRSPIDHHDDKSLSAWIDRHNRYSSMEARALHAGNVVGETRPRLFGRPDQRRMAMRLIYYAVPGRAFWYFLYRYVIRLGFLDGRAGFRFCFLHAVFMYWIELKLEETRSTGVLPVDIWPARGAPHPRLTPAAAVKQQTTSG